MPVSHTETIDQQPPNEAYGVLVPRYTPLAYQKSLEKPFGLTLRPNVM